MCGLAGFARHPDGGELDVLVSVFSDLIPSMQHRGRHATGVGVVTPRGAVVRKWAIDPREAVKTSAWDRTLDLITTDTTTVLGHVRHATLPNAKDDRAAHPFIFSQSVGAHNGIIDNWQQIRREFEVDSGDWQTDSEAALYLLDRFDDPRKALDRLDGVWALTWSKRGKLYLVRTEERPLACAYIADIRALVWCSERPILQRVLQDHGFERRHYEIWDTKPGTLYAYDPLRFDYDGSHATRVHCSFKGRKGRKAAAPRIASAPVTLSKRRSDLELSLRALNERIEHLSGMIESLKAENDHLYSVLISYGLLDNRPLAIASGPSRPGGWRQDEMFCEVCGDPGDLVVGRDGAMVHEGCEIPF